MPLNRALIACATGALLLALGGAAAAAPKNPNAGLIGDVDLKAAPNWPGNAAEQNLWVDDVQDRIWGLPGGFAYVRLERVAPVATTRLELEDGTIVGTLVPGTDMWRVDAPKKTYKDDLYVSYLAPNGRARVRARVAAMLIKDARDQPTPEQAGDNIDIMAMVGVSTDVRASDANSKREDAIDLLFRSAVPGDRIGVVSFGARAKTNLKLSVVDDDDTAKELSARARKKLNDAVGVGSDYDAALDEGFKDIYLESRKGDLMARPKLGIFVADSRHEATGPDRGPQFRNTHIRFTHSPGPYSWPICVVQIGTSFGSRDVNRLKRIAKATKGRYVKIADEDRLVDAVAGCRGIAASEYSTERGIATNVKPNAKIGYRSTIPARRRFAAFVVTGGNIRHAVTLIGPSGQRYSPGNLPRGIRLKTGRSWTRYEVDGPRAARWQLAITASGVAARTTDTVRVRTIVDRETRGTELGFAD